MLLPGVGARTGGVEYSIFGSRLQTDNREPNNENRTSTVSGSVTRPLKSGASARFLGRGEFGRTGTPGTTAFGRPDMDAFFRHRDGSFLGGWNQPLGSRVTQQTSYSYIVTKYRSTNLDRPTRRTRRRFGDLVAAFPSSDFLYDSETEIERHHFEYRADAVVARNQTLTAAFAYDGERGVLTNHRSTAAPQRPERNNTGTTVQYEATGERVSLVGGIRFENNGSFGFYVAPRVAASWLVSSGNDGNGLGATRLRAQRRARHQGAAVHSVVQPVAQLPRQSRSRSPSGRADSTSAIEQRFAGDRAAIEATYFANHFDDLISLGPFDPVTFNAQYENIGETRASGLELRRHRASSMEDWRFSGGYTFLDSKVIRSISSSPIFAPGRAAVPASAPLGIAAGLVLAQSRQPGARRRVHRIARRQPTSTFPTITSNEGYAAWNASGEVRLARRTAGFVTIDNLADRDYMEPLGYPALGRTVRAGIRTRF